jgi:hypothetical protein
MSTPQDAKSPSPPTMTLPAQLPVVPKLAVPPPQQQVVAGGKKSSVKSKILSRFALFPSKKRSVVQFEPDEEEDDDDETEEALMEQGEDCNHDDLDEKTLTETEQIRKNRKLEKYQPVCSNVSENGELFISGEYIAKNKHILEACGITHIVNAAASVIPSYFEDAGKIKYLNVFLMDDEYEDVECVFYLARNFIQSALSKKENKVLVHCRQGVSRSAAVVISYYMITNKWTYNEAFQYVRKKRPIIDPNIGFMAQLRQFEKRLLQGVSKPRLYKIDRQAPNQMSSHLVGKVVRDLTKPLRQMFDSVQSTSLDTNGCFVLHPPTNEIVIWKGRKAQPQHESIAMVHARNLIEYEGGVKISVIREGDEGYVFWRWFEDMKKCFDEMIDLKDSDTNGSGSLLQPRKQARMFEWTNGTEVAMFDSDDLHDDGAFLVFDRNAVSVAYFWIGVDCALNQQTIEEATAAAYQLLDKHQIEGVSKVQIFRQPFDAIDSEFWDLFVDG